MAAQIPDWMQRFQQQDLDEEKEEAETPVKLLDANGRRFIWWLCTQYGFKSDGVMGQACNLLERYIPKKIKQFSHSTPRSSAWRRFKKYMAKRVPLLASVCVSLTTKMMSSERQLNSKTIRDVLTQTFMPCALTLAQINAAELDVLSTLGFTIPMFTNVEKALMMAVDVGMKGNLIEGVSIVTEVAEYYRSDIQEQVIAVAFSIHEDRSIQRRDIANVRHIHLVAGSVVATGLFFQFSGSDPIPRLSFLTQCSRVYIKCIGDIILKRLVLECGSIFESSVPTPRALKRKLSSD